MMHDMCFNSCSCPICSSSRYDQLILAQSSGKKKVAHKQFPTVPIELERNEGKVHVYEDFLDGSNYINVVQEGKIKDMDVLYQCKESDCWIAIWVIFDHSPDSRYKKKHVLPGVPTGPGLAYLNGFVGHHGKNGQHKTGCSHYYPVLLKPHDYNIAGCSHPDVNVNDIQGASAEMYWNNLIYCFGSDIMHLLSLNLPDLLLKLWRGTIEYVGDTRPYLPGSFDCVPCNIAEKINSGYKAWEFWLFLYGLGPAILYKHLPDDIWEHFCRLVHAVHITSQHSISRDKLCLANRLFLDWSKEFEMVYYQRLPTCIHFVLAKFETKGPLICASQRTMERTIGNLPSNPYANLGQHAIHRAQINALKSIMPSLDTSDTKHLPRFAKDLRSGYALLKCQDQTSRATTVHEGWAIQDYIEHTCSDSPILQQFSSDGTIRVCQ
ncbi:hypothetical protein F4604DRAFT_1875828 [Suillus subluteus]|nr:hypothetical protein F4604DRAFT_1875828 [Suillus subluteus]